MEDLKERVSTFCHWRVDLMYVLKKFGESRGDRNLILHHGVNKKMLVKVIFDSISLHLFPTTNIIAFCFVQSTQTFAFFGPFSTSSLYHVAREFATAKGMVLTVTSHFPRLGLCNAFDAKKLSDYPQEHEWIIGFCYARILKFETEDMNRILGSHAQLKDHPMASLAKEVSIKSLFS